MRRVAPIGVALWLALALVALARQADSSEKQAVKSADFTVDINRASVEEFKKLPGVGPKLAQEIVAYREKHGPFRRVEDLMALKGIGAKKWKALRPHLRVGSRKKPK